MFHIYLDILHIKFHIYVDICIYIFHTQPEEILYIILNNFEHETKFHGMNFPLGSLMSAIKTNFRFGTI